MSFKFNIGDFVKYKPIGRGVGIFKVVRRMPEEFRAIDWKYRIKSDQEDFERSALQCDLSPSVAPEQFEEVRPLRRVGGHH